MRFHLGSSALAHEPGPLGQVILVGDQAAAHIRSQGLFRIEGEPGGVAQGAGVAPFIFAEHRLAGILIDDQAVLFGQGVDRVHIAHQAGFVDHQDGPGAVGEARFDGFRADIDRAGGGVGEDRDIVLPDQALDRPVIGDRADDDLVAGLELQGRRQHRQGRGAARGGDAMLHPQLFGEGLLEALDHIAGQPTLHHLLKVLQGVGAHDARKRIGQRAGQARHGRCASI